MHALQNMYSVQCAVAINRAPYFQRIWEYTTELAYYFFWCETHSLHCSCFALVSQSIFKCSIQLHQLSHSLNRLYIALNESGLSYLIEYCLMATHFIMKICVFFIACSLSKKTWKNTGSSTANQVPFCTRISCPHCERRHVLHNQCITDIYNLSFLQNCHQSLAIKSLCRWNVQKHCCTELMKYTMVLCPWIFLGYFRRFHVYLLLCVF